MPVNSRTVLAIAFLLGFVAVASAADFSLTSTHKVRSGMTINAGFEVDDRSQTVHDVTACYGKLCANVWLGLALEDPNFSDGKLGNECDPVDVWYSLNVGGFAVTPEYAFYIISPAHDGSNDFHSPQLRISRQIGNIEAYFKYQGLVPTGDGWPEGGTYLYLGVTTTLARVGDLSFGSKFELVRDTGAVGGQIGYLGRVGIYPSLDMGRWSLDLGYDRFQEISVDDRGNHNMWTAGVTWKVVAPKSKD